MPPFSREEPLSDHELRVLRGMMDEYEAHRILALRRDAFWTHARIRTAVGAAFVTVVVQLVTLLLLLAHFLPHH